MSTQTLPSPLAVPTDDDVDHWVCCDPNVAYCGADVSAHSWVFTPDDDETVCRLCLLAEELDRFCRVCDP